MNNFLNEILCIVEISPKENLKDEEEEEEKYA